MTEMFNQEHCEMIKQDLVLDDEIFHFWNYRLFRHSLIGTFQVTFVNIFTWRLLYQVLYLAFYKKEKSIVSSLIIFKQSIEYSPSEDIQKSNLDYSITLNSSSISEYYTTTMAAYRNYYYFIFHNLAYKPEIQTDQRKVKLSTVLTNRVMPSYNYQLVKSLLCYHELLIQKCVICKIKKSAKYSIYIYIV